MAKKAIAPNPGFIRLPAKKKPTTKANVTGTILLFCSMPIVCWLCGITVPANTEHRCTK